MYSSLITVYGAHDVGEKETNKKKVKKKRSELNLTDTKLLE